MGSIIGGFADWFDAIINGISGIADSLNPTSDRFILKVLLNRFNPQSDDFFLKGILIPTDGYLEQRYSQFKNDLSAWLGFSDYMSFFSTMQGVSSSAGNYDATISVYGVGSMHGRVLDTTAFNSNKNWIYTVIRGVLAVMLYIYNINQVYKLLNRGATIAGIGQELQGKGGKSDG